MTSLRLQAKASSWDGGPLRLRLNWALLAQAEGLNWGLWVEPFFPKVSSPAYCADVTKGPSRLRHSGVGLPDSCDLGQKEDDVVESTWARWGFRGLGPGNF